MRTRSVVLLSVGGALLAVLGISAYLLVRGIGAFQAAEKRLNRQEQLLRDYYARRPFPSKENVVREQANAQALRGWLRDVTDALRQGQVGPQQRTPSAFMIMFGRTHDALTSLADARRVRLPPGAAFGFERYMASGVVPAPADVPRLAQQLVIMGRLCRILFENGVASVDQMEREVFEGADSISTPARGAIPLRSRRAVRGGDSGSEGGGWTWRTSRDAGVLEPNDRFASLHFSFAFEAREDALRRVLDALAADTMFVAVSLLRVEKRHNDIAPAAVSPTAPVLTPGVRPGEFPSRNERVMSGPTLDRPLSVHLELDVYQFAPALPEAGS